VSYNTDQVQVVLINGYRKPAAVTAEIGTMQAFELGPARLTWTRGPRILIRTLQKVFLTAVMLPLMFVGAFALIRSGNIRWLAVLLVVPVYYMCIQSALWTEFRYVLPMYYFLFILAAGGLGFLGDGVWRALSRTASK